MRKLGLALLLMTGACSRVAEGESLGRMGGAPPILMLTSSVQATNGSVLGEARLIEEMQGDRLVMAVKGLPEGRYLVQFHANSRCSGAGFADAGPALADPLPPLVVEADGRGDLFADIAPPRLRAAGEPRLDADGTALVVSLGGQPIGCAAFRLKPQGGS